MIGSWDFALILSTDISTPQGLMAIRIMQMFQTIGIFIFPSLVIAFLASEKPFGFLGFKAVSGRFILLSFLLMIVAIPGINLMASINAKVPLPEWMIEFEKTAENLIKTLLNTENPIILFINILMVAILPAIGEELFFRGVLQHYFRKISNSTFWGIVITALIFSAIHFQFQGFVPRFALGMIFGYLYVWTQSIWIPIAIHFVNNGLAVVIFYLISNGEIPAQTETIGELNVYWQLGVLSIIASAALTLLIYKERVKVE